MSNSQDDFMIRPRKSWHAAVSREVIPVKSPVVYVFCMNTHTQPCEFDVQCEDIVRRLQHMHMNVHNFEDIRYNFLIGEDGTVFEGRGWEVQPLLPLKFTSYKDKSVLMGFIGEYTENELPSVMRTLREKLVDFGIANNYIHSEFIPIEIFQKIKGPFHHNIR